MSLLDLTEEDLQKEIDKIALEYQSRHRKWTEKEVEVLVKLMDKRVGWKKIAELLDRTYDSVQQKARRL